jgi:transcriptional/translational regulatory protein YebC/TACO1
VHAFDKVAHALEHAEVRPESSEIAYIPLRFMPVTDVSVAQTIVKLHDAREELDDVQAVFSNEEMEEAVGAEVASGEK